jgi:predicted phosphate transport protein (TIGR00153 family)
MAEFKRSPFHVTRTLKTQMDDLLDVVSQGALAYKLGVANYVRDGWDERAQEKFEQLNAFESRGDELYKAIGISLYTEMLLPDTSGDVMGLLGSLDSLLDDMLHSLTVYRIEQPQIPDDARDLWIECAGHAAETVEHVVVAARCYIRDPNEARDHIHKIHFYEKETDRATFRILEQLFQSDLPLDHKMLLRGHVWLMDRVADRADDAGDALAIYAVKRSV